MVGTMTAGTHTSSHAWRTHSFLELAETKVGRFYYFNKEKENSAKSSLLNVLQLVWRDSHVRRLESNSNNRVESSYYLGEKKILNDGEWFLSKYTCEEILDSGQHSLHTFLNHSCSSQGLSLAFKSQQVAPEIAPSLFSESALKAWWEHCNMIMSWNMLTGVTSKTYVFPSKLWGADRSLGRGSTLSVN